MDCKAWIGHSHCPQWVQLRLKGLEDPSGDPSRGIRAQYREGEGPSFHNEIQHGKEKTNTSSLLAALKACSSSRDLERGKMIHTAAIGSGDDSKIYVGNTLVDMYAKCGSMVNARKVFDNMLCHTVVSWTALMLGYADNGQGELALELFARMRPEGCSPNGRTFVAALKACTSLAVKEEGKQVDGKLVKMRSLEKGLAVHSQAASSSCDSNIYVGNTLVDMYAKCGSMVDARRVFDKMQCHTVVSWNALMLGYAENGQGELALELVAHMRPEGCAPNARTFVAAIQACTSLAVKELGRQVDGKLVKMESLAKALAIHSQAASSGCDSDIYVASNLVDMYAKCGSMVDARRVFEKMPHHDVVSWTALMLGYADNGQGELALELFERMRPEGCVPNRLTFVAALKACINLAEKEEGRQVDGKFVKMGSLEKGLAIHIQAASSGCDLDVYVASTLVDMYAKCGRMVDAHKIFDRMWHPDVVSWNALMFGYVENGEGELALELFARMRPEGCAPNCLTFVAALKACTSLAVKEEGKQVDAKLVKIGSLEKALAVHSQAASSSCDSDIYVASTLVDMYAKCGSMVDAHRVFDRMRHPDVVCWTALMLGYADNGQGDRALELFARMRPEGCAPNARTFVAALKACGLVVALEIGKAIHEDISSCGVLENDAVLATSLVDFYGKCGSMVDAQQVFDSLATKDLVTWTALIAGYSCQGDTKRVFDLFHMMRDEGLQADGVTFLCILTACSHAGLVEKGKEYFEAMCSNYGIIPGIEHYVCMVDMLGRANQLDDAVAMVKSMPFKPDAVTWTTVLGACRKWRNVVVGRLAFESLLRLDEKDATAYVLMANIYGSVGMCEEQSQIEDMTVKARAWKKPGQSWWTDQAGVVHTFVVGDASHSQSEDIHGKLKHVLVKMKEQGYVADVGSVLHNISDDEKEDGLCGHSVKLAIACALINTIPATTIRIVNNLRVCDDCHRATAIISKIEQRSIICRDASRFHVFKDGKCSCGDFW